MSKQLDESAHASKKVWLNIYNASDNFLSATYQPLLQNYDDILNLDIDYIGGDGQTESNITNRLGNRLQHNKIRGDTYDIIMENVQNATSDNICFYMAINQINKNGIRDVCLKAKNMPNVRAVSFNFHTPYPDTKELLLSPGEKAACCNVIAKMMEEGAPVFNLKSAFPYLIRNSFPTPCYQCVVMENGKLSTCGRCIEVEGLCEKCGYFFVAEYTLLFRGNIKIIFEMLRTYLKYI